MKIYTLNWGIEKPKVGILGLLLLAPFLTTFAFSVRRVMKPIYIGMLFSIGIAFCLCKQHGLLLFCCSFLVPMVIVIDGNWFSVINV